MIINTGSKQGITNPPGNAGYNVSKAMVKAYTEQRECARSLRDGRARVSVEAPISGTSCQECDGDSYASQTHYASAAPRQQHCDTADASRVPAPQPARVRLLRPPLHVSQVHPHCEASRANSSPGWVYTGLSTAKTKPSGAWTAEQTVEYMFDKVLNEGDFYVVCPDNETPAVSPRQPRRRKMRRAQRSSRVGADIRRSTRRACSG